MKAFLFLAIFLCSCNNEAAFDPTIPPALLRAYNDGRILLDDAPITAEDLTETLRQIKNDGGGIWYWVELGGEPPFTNQSVIHFAITESEVPVSRSLEEDFSDEYFDGIQGRLRLGFPGNPIQECSLHQLQFETVMILAEYGYGIYTYQAEMAEWKKSNAPYARTEIDGGCIVGPPYMTTKACPTCNELEWEWRRKWRPNSKT